MIIGKWLASCAEHNKRSGRYKKWTKALAKALAKALTMALGQGSGFVWTHVRLTLPFAGRPGHICLDIIKLLQSIRLTWLRTGTLERLSTKLVGPATWLLSDKFRWRFPASVDLIYALCCFSQDLNDPTLQLRQSVRCVSYAFEECST